MVTLLLSLGFVVLVGLTGLAAVRLCAGRAVPDTLAVVLAFPVGLYALAWLAFLLCTWGPPLGRGGARALVLATGLGGACLLARRGQLRLRRSDAADRPLAANLTLAACVAVALVLAAAPPLLQVFSSSFGWDATYYHLPAARALFETGRLPATISPSYQELPFAYPPGLFVGYALEWLFAGRVNHLVPMLWSTAFALATAGVLMALVREHLGGTRLAAVVAAVLLLGDAIVWSSELDTGTDLPLAFFVIAAVDAVLRWRRRESRGLLVLAGLLAGAGAFTKYFGLAWVGFLGAAVAWPRISESGKQPAPASPVRRIVGPVLVFGGVALAVVLPVLGRNLVRLGNPVYPLFAAVLGGRDIDEFARVHVLGWLHPTRPFGGFRWSDLGELAAWSPTVLALVGAARGDRHARMLVAFAVAYGTLVLGFLVGPLVGLVRLRMALPLFPLLCAAAAPPLARALEGRERPLLLAAAGLGLAVVGVLLEGPPWDALVSSGSLPGLRLLGLRHATTARGFLLVALAGFAALQPAPSGQAGLPEPGVARLGRLLALPLMLGTLLYPALGVREGALRGIITGHRTLPDHGRVVPFPATQMLRYHPDARVLTLDDRRYLIPAPVVPFDAPAMWPILRRRVAYDEAAAHLRAIGITHLYLDGTFETHPLWIGGPVLGMLENSRYFRLIDSAHGGRLYELVRPVQRPAGK